MCIGKSTVPGIPKPWDVAKGSKIPNAISIPVTAVFSFFVFKTIE